MNDLPANIDAEKTILGSILLDNEYFYDETADLVVEDFSLDSHRILFMVINDILSGMVDGIYAADITTIGAELERRHLREKIGGIAYVASLTEGLPIRPVVGDYIRLVKDKARLRRIVYLCNNAAARAYDQVEQSETILSDVQDRFLELAAEGSDHAVPIGSVTPKVEARIKEKREVSNERKALELTWGVPELDEHTHGAFGGEFTVLGGDSGGGKTAFLAQMFAANAAEKTPCALFSLEMQREKMAQRFYPLLSEILTANHLRDPRLMNLHTHVPEMEKISQQLIHMPILIDDTSPIHLNVLLARMRMMIRRHKVRLIGIDYLQLIGHSQRTEVEGIREIVFKLRDFAKAETNTHVIALSQYSKSDGFQKKRQRGKSDLYGGSAIHHAAQNILQISIEDPEKRDKNDLLDVEFRFSKQREGRVGKKTTHFDRDHLKFREPIPQLGGM